MAKKQPRKRTVRPQPPATVEVPEVQEVPDEVLDRQPLEPRENELILRMYRQGLGDCFLLAIGMPEPAAPKFLLIDCGIHMRQTDGPLRLLQVMQDLAQATNNHLDVVVATHEHADHLSGFVQKGSPFLRPEMRVDHLWLAWTEKRGDGQADALRQRHGTAREVIDKAVERAQERANRSLAEHLNGLRDFEQPAQDSVDPVEVLEAIARITKEDQLQQPLLDLLNISQHDRGLAGAEAKPKGPSSNELAIGLLGAKVGPNIHYGDPGKPSRLLMLDEVPNLRAYVLGPPRDETLLKKDLPTKVADTSHTGHGTYQEVYLSGRAADRGFGLSPALEGPALDSSATVHDETHHPFAAGFRQPLPVGRTGRKTLASLPEPTRVLLTEHYFGKDHAWRRIDEDWLAAAEQLALNLDSDTNNTSLALALEWGPPGQGQVLLFPGDAQVGNWMSWIDLTFVVEGKRITASDLLKRTLVYKVGHHGSHNATCKAARQDSKTKDSPFVPFGLELMDDILALIPVDRAAAEKKMPIPWEMPHRPLYERLREKAQRRVLRSDLRLDPLPDNSEPDLVPPSPAWSEIPGLRGAKWRRAAQEFEAGTPGPLFYDILLPLPK